MQAITIRSYETKKSIIPPICLLLLGILLFVNPGGIVKFISYIFGAVFLTLGVSKFIMDSRRNNKTTGDTFYSLIMVVIGLIFMFCSGTVEFVIRLVVGIWILINALNTLAVGINMVRVNSKSVLTLIIGFVLLMMGVYTIFVSNLVLSTIGLLLVIYAVLEIVDYIYIAVKNK